MGHRSFGLPRSARLRFAAAVGAGGLVFALAAGCTGSSTSAASSASSAEAVPAGAPAAAMGTSEAPAAGATSAAAGAAGAAPSAASSAAASAAGDGSAGTAGTVGTVGTVGSAAGRGLPDVGAGVQAADRQVVHTATVTLNVAVNSTNKGAAADQQVVQAAVNAAFVRVSAIATGAGYVSAANGSGATMSVTLRVPVSGYEAAMDALQDIAPIVSRQESTDDVTAQMIDISSRMQTMTASVNRVRALLSKADKIGDVIAIESELTGREADLESLQRQQAALAGQTSLSTITVVLQGSITGVKKVLPPPPPAERSGFLGGLANGWDAVRHVGHAGLTVVGTLIPFLPVVAIIVGAGLILRRRVRRPTVPTLAAPAGDPHPVD